MESPLKLPAEIRCAQDYARLANNCLPAPAHAYITGGCGQDITARANLDAFTQWAIYPRLLRDMTRGHTRTRLGETEWVHPIGLAPVAYQKLTHPQGELETARAAHATDTCMIASTLSSAGLEEIARVAGPSRWFQLYLQARQADTHDLVARAEAAGYGAIVLTVDAAIQTASLRALEAGFRMPATIMPANLLPYQQQEAVPVPGSQVFQGLMRQAPLWADLDDLLARTHLPVWVKGVLHPEDALMLKARGVAGLVVSNHGGRSLDGAPAALQVLPLIRAAVGQDLPLLFDGGIRSGADVFKALALGANAVLVGRLQVYALSVAGALGVAHMLKLLREEFEVCMAQAGVACPGAIGPEALLPALSPVSRESRSC